MNISLSQQVSATYARNHFREVNEKAILEGMCVIVRKSTPTTVVLSMAEYEKLHNASEKYKEHKSKFNAPVKKVTLEELRKNATFDKYAGSLQDDYPEKTAMDLQHSWYKYVD